MMDLSKSFLTPFDPTEIEDNDAPFGFLHAEIAGRKQWWLVEAGGDDISLQFHSGADGFQPPTWEIDVNDCDGCPWIPLQLPDPEIPEQHLPACRLTLDCPGGERITRSWGPGPMSERGREGIKRMLDVAMGGPAND